MNRRQLSETVLGGLGQIQQDPAAVLGIVGATAQTSLD